MSLLYKNTLVENLFFSRCTYKLYYRQFENILMKGPTVKYCLHNARVLTDGGEVSQDVFLHKGRVFFSNPFAENDAITTIDCCSYLILPGFVDVHVHLREPGFFYKEDLVSGTRAAARGGFTSVCSMPNIDPVPSSLVALDVQLDLIAQKALVRVYPYGSITRDQSGTGELAKLEELAEYCIGFSDDGKGIQERATMREAMIEAKRLNRPIVEHCEDESKHLPGGCIHDGSFAREHNLVGISSESEWSEVARNIVLAEETGCHLHICHVSTKESVELIRKAKAKGVPVTAETAPHYLIFCQDDLEDQGRWKMNPPLREDADRTALLIGVKDGTIDCIATDHAPHSAEEKARGLAGSNFGIVGLETAFASLYTHLVCNNPLDPGSDSGLLSLSELVQLMSGKPARLFGLIGSDVVYDGMPADLCVVDTKARYVVDANNFASKGKASPFDGCELRGRICMTIVGGQIIYDER